MRCRRAKNATKLCCDCKKAPLVQYGRCTACFRAMDPALFAHLKKLTRAERQIEFEKIARQPALRKWEWTGMEEELIAEFGQQ